MKIRKIFSLVAFLKRMISSKPSSISALGAIFMPFPVCTVFKARNKRPFAFITLPSILKSVMEVVDNIPMSGADKKIYAIKIVREIIDEKTYGEEEAVLLLLIDNGTVANMIDLIIDATRGNLNINALGNTVGSCASACIPYIFKKTNKNKKTIKVEKN